MVTMAWGATLKTFFLGQRSPLTFSFQSAMPRLPVPALKDTVAGYLRSVQPIMSADEYAKVKKDADEFLNSNVARKCQAMLVLKSWLAGNYVSDWCVALNLTFHGRLGGILLIERRVSLSDGVVEPTSWAGGKSTCIFGRARLS
jgi:hypothetical protein